MQCEQGCAPLFEIRRPTWHMFSRINLNYPNPNLNIHTAHRLLFNLCLCASLSRWACRGHCRSQLAVVPKWRQFQAVFSFQKIQSMAFTTTPTADGESTVKSKLYLIVWNKILNSIQASGFVKIRTGNFRTIQQFS